jgi:hypothetical protein
VCVLLLLLLFYASFVVVVHVCSRGNDGNYFCLCCDPRRCHAKMLLLALSFLQKRFLPPTHTHTHSHAHLLPVLISWVCVFVCVCVCIVSILLSFALSFLFYYTVFFYLFSIRAMLYTTSHASPLIPRVMVPGRA